MAAFFAVFFDLPFTFNENFQPGGIRHPMRNFSPGGRSETDTDRFCPPADLAVIRTEKRNACQGKNEINEVLRGPQGKPEYMLNHQNSGDGEVRTAPGVSPEGSPENKTGIVRCDLIDCANNFKEITTMPVRSLCQNFLKNILAPLKSNQTIGDG